MKEALCNALEGANKRNREYREQIERLQEQLKEARHTIYCIANTDGSDCKTILETIIRDANLYLEKWGIPSESVKNMEIFPLKSVNMANLPQLKE